MSYHPRIETPEIPSFVTTRSRNSELWFVNNSPLEDAILGYGAKFSKRYNAKIYALAIEGNHIQGPIGFPDGNRAHFMRDFNSCIARAVKRTTPEYRGGTFWARRYSAEFLPNDEDVEEYFFYTVLQPIKDGLVERISQYPGYNCFYDAIRGIKRKYKFVRWAEYNAAKRYDKNLKVSDYIEIVELEYARLPGYENLSRKEYVDLMNRKLEERRLKIVEDRRNRGLGFVGREKLLKVKRGTLPKNTKTSDIRTHRPRVLSKDDKTRAEYKAWYFSIYFEYKVASKEYRNGNVEIEFPKGTYKPYADFHAKTCIDTA